MDEYLLVKATSQVKRQLQVTGESFLPFSKNCITRLAEDELFKGLEDTYNDHQDAVSMRMMRNREGLCMPIKMAYERVAARRVCRLPFLVSSNIMEDTLSGRVLRIGFEDFLNQSEHAEGITRPYVVAEQYSKNKHT